MSRPRICIAHQTAWIGDAIGNDIAGAYELLANCGYELALLCENVHPEFAARYRVIAGGDLAAGTSGFDLMLYHHSINWPTGEELLRRFSGPVVIKYHSITPPEFFEAYAPRYRALCTEGRAQSARIARLPNVVRWHLDSSNSSTEIGQLGVPENMRAVVPPFNHVDRAFQQAHSAVYSPAGPFHALFVGRRLPNKGHAHLLRTLAAWRDLFPDSELHCRIIGAPDEEVASYYRELKALEQSLGVCDRVQWLGQVSGPELDDLFRTSHVYLNLSEHEGFCAPVVEAQAAGLPLITTNASAMREIAGFDQVAVPVPRSQQDYDAIAGLAHEICTSSELRRVLVDAGCRNAFQRFTPYVVEGHFLSALEPVLQMLEA